MPTFVELKFRVGLELKVISVCFV